MLEQFNKIINFTLICLCVKIEMIKIRMPWAGKQLDTFSVWIIYQGIFSMQIRFNFLNFEVLPAPPSKSALPLFSVFLALNMSNSSSIVFGAVVPLLDENGSAEKPGAAAEVGVDQGSLVTGDAATVGVVVEAGPHGSVARKA